LIAELVIFFFALCLVLFFIVVPCLQTVNPTLAYWIVPTVCVSVAVAIFIGVRGKGEGT
jgi:hypothetical protein